MRGITQVRMRVGARALMAAFVGTALWLLAAAAAHASETVTHTFGATGAAQTFIVPPGVTMLGVRAVGGRGHGGGEPAEVTGELSVAPGQTLYVEVGGSPTGKAGGFNGGGDGGDSEAGGGGGASDVRTVPGTTQESLHSRLIVAGGSGGGSSNGEKGGAAEAEGEPKFGGGQPGTQEHGGLAAEPLRECTEFHGREGEVIPATFGTLGTGGNGESCQSKFHGGSAGGGGAGGLFGGGGGAAEFEVEEHIDRGTGGGGGSSLVPEGGSSGLTGGEPALVEFSYPRPESPPIVTTGGASSLAAHTATLTGTVDPEDSTVGSCEFEFGTSVLYEDTVPCSTSPGSGDQPVAVSAAIEGLSPETTYHYRVVATNGEGTSAGADAEFTTSAHEPPTVSEYTPNIGPQKGGNTVTITGTEMNYVTEVTFKGPRGFIAEATGLKHLSPTTLSVVVPASFEEERTIIIHDDLGHDVVVGKYRSLPQPAVRKLSPKGGGVEGGATVVITGAGFEEATEVLFGSTPGTIQPGGTYSTLTVTTPVHASGKFDVRVVSPGGTSALTKKDVYDFTGITVAGVSPGTGPRAGGTSVTVTGNGFEPGIGSTVFKFGKAQAKGVECASTTQCTMTTPASSKTGAAAVVASVGKAKSKKSAAAVFDYE
ncbi:MAG TPA: IPT/TIG domain-containing protein [Solirubrobacteraceae bacterium]|jgi:hypothetical protein|nr:IPT/TIG domain-containing protein [Solirubrobacteraceae bacterium]